MRPRASAPLTGLDDDFRTRIFPATHVVVITLLNELMESAQIVNLHSERRSSLTPV